MRLLSLSSYVQKKLTESKISQGHAKVLVGLDEKKQKVIIDSVIGQKLSVRDTENMVKSHKGSVPTVTQKVESPSLVQKYAVRFEKVLDVKHKIKSKSIEIYFDDEEEIESFLEVFSSFKEKKSSSLLGRILK